MSCLPYCLFMFEKKINGAPGSHGRRIDCGWQAEAPAPLFKLLFLRHHRVGQFAQAFDANRDLIAGTKPNRRLACKAHARRRAGRDDVARLQSEYARSEEHTSE